MKTTVLSTLVTALLAAPPAFAADDAVIVMRQHLATADAPHAPHAPGDAAYWRSWAQDFSNDLRHDLGMMFSPRLAPGKVVKGAPYSAEVITETSQALADGNVISRKKSGAVYRDGEGRTRQETGSEGRERTIFINDPVANSNIVLSPNSKRAVMTAPRAMSYRHEMKDKQVVRVGGSEVRVEDGKVFVDGKEVTSGRTEVVKGGKVIVVDGGKVTIDGKPLGLGEGNQHVIVKRVETADGAQHEEVSVKVIRGGDAMVIEAGTPFAPIPPVPPVPPVPGVAPVAPTPPSLPGINSMRFESTAKLGKGNTTSLGMKDFDGVKAEGKATTWTIPAGEIGNKNAITVMHETWYSPDLQVTVYSRHSDPRTGESVYRLASIRRGEPAPDLFKVPEDYKTRGRAPKG